MKKTTLIILITIVAIFVYKLVFKDGGALAVVNTIKDILSEETHQDDMLKKAGQVARLKKFFHEDFQGEIEHLNIRGKAAVNEHLTILVRLYCPMISEIIKISVIEEERKSCRLFIDTVVKTTRPAPGLKEKYYIEAYFVKDNGNWKILSIKERDNNSL